MQVSHKEWSDSIAIRGSFGSVTGCSGTGCVGCIREVFRLRDLRWDRTQGPDVWLGSSNVFKWSQPDSEEVSQRSRVSGSQVKSAAVSRAAVVSRSQLASFANLPAAGTLSNVNLWNLTQTEIVIVSSLLFSYIAINRLLVKIRDPPFLGDHQWPWNHQGDGLPWSSRWIQMDRWGSTRFLCPAYLDMTHMTI